MSQAPDLKIGEMVWIEPAGVPVPFETRLRGGVFSGQRGHPQFPPQANQVLPKGQKRVKKLTGPEEVQWSEWWRRRYVQGDIKIAKAPAKTKAEKSKGGDK